jgi:threonine/homoserine/homoserine lactone efflux protein
MNFDTWLLYVAAVFVLTVTPGPSVLMCVTNSVNFGARKTMFCALGSVLAVLCIIASSALGLGAVLQTSELAFAIIKWLGVAYLLYIGVTTLLSKQGDFQLTGQTDHQPVSAVKLFVRGFLVGASNPKALLFFTAFLPQFIDAKAAMLPQLGALCLTFAAFELFWLMFYAIFAARLAPWLKVRGRAVMFNRVSGSIFVVAALALATVKRNKEAAG